MSDAQTSSFRCRLMTIARKHGPLIVGLAYMGSLSLVAVSHIEKTSLDPRSINTLMHEAFRGSRSARKELVALPEDYARLYKVAVDLLRLGGIYCFFFTVVLLGISAMKLFQLPGLAESVPDPKK